MLRRRSSRLTLCSGAIEAMKVYRDHRSLFPENPRPPLGLDSCVCGHVFRVLPPSSMASLEGEAAECGLLHRFLGGSRPLRHDSGEKSRGPTFFHHAPGRCFSYIARISKRAKSVKKGYKIQKSNFAKLGCVCDFVDGAGALETFLLRVPQVLQDELPCSGAHLPCFR